MNNAEIVSITDPDEISARIAWSLLVEPNDAAAGALTRTYGFSQALEALLTRSDDAAVANGANVTGPDLDRLRTRIPTPSDVKRLTGETIPRALEITKKHEFAMIDPNSVPGLADLGDNAPLTLWVSGDLAALTNPIRLGVSGSRAATGYGEYATTEFVADFVRHGATIHSGLAYGIDGTAHRAALAHGGKTVGWLAGGLDRPYPAGHHQLMTTIATTPGSAVVSELPPGITPSRWRFLARQRLIAAATQATLIPEAGRVSGALATAGHARALHRHVAGIPGPITSPASQGVHRLIKEGVATIATLPGDLYRPLGIPTP